MTTERQPPAPHSHTKPGDGGFLPVPQEVLSGTTTVAANTTEYMDLGSLDRDGFYYARAYPDGDYGGVRFTERASPTSGDGWSLYWDGSDNDWNLALSNGEDYSIDVTWKVFEL